MIKLKKLFMHIKLKMKTVINNIQFGAKNNNGKELL